MSKVTRKIHCFEQLDEIAAEKNVFKQQALLKEYGSKHPLAAILSLNFNSTIKLDLPEGMPPMDLKDMDAQTHPDLMGLLASGIHRLPHCTTASNLTKNKKETMFYEILINCPLKDAEILCSAKDKSLAELYPSITSELVASVFPQYVK
jgi:hypothetical protein